MVLKQRVLQNLMIILILFTSAVFCQTGKKHKDIFLEKIPADTSNHSIKKFNYEFYVNRGDYKKAFEELLDFKAAAESTLIAGFRNYTDYQKLKYETVENERKLQIMRLQLEKNNYIMYGLGAVLALTGFIGFLLLRQFKMKERQRISEMNNTIIELTQKNLRQQMNPHFIFNTLNSIQYYMYQNDKISTNNYLTKFSNMMRKILENSENMSVPIQSELDAVNLYLELESLRFKDKFEYDISVDENIDTLIYEIPTMIIQPFVENSIVHGLFNKEGKGKIKIELRLKDDMVECNITDNGIGRKAAAEIKMNKDTNHKSLGIKITGSRVEMINKLYNKNMSISYTDLTDEKGEPAGTSVKLLIPVMAGL